MILAALFAGGAHADDYVPNEVIVKYAGDVPAAKRNAVLHRNVCAAAARHAHHPGSGTLADVANCIDWSASQGAKVISMSLEGGDATTLQQAVAAAWNGGNGAVIVAAAGNEGDSSVRYPANYAEVVSVAATDNRDARAGFSNANPDVEISAPGVDVLSTVPGGGYETSSGTSMATPHVSGIAAILWQLHPALNAAAIRFSLDASVDDLGPAGRDPSFGFGRANLCRAAGGC